MITAIVFVKADVARIPEVAERIAALDGVSEVYSVTGQIDLIVLVRVRAHEDVAAVVAARTDRAWLLPVVMLLASPVVGTGNVALLAAIPRLRGLTGSATATGSRRPAPTAVV